MEEVSWRQKSRVLWLREGVKCTMFFFSFSFTKWPTPTGGRTPLTPC
jgi:hypothetical protein